MHIKQKLLIENFFTIHKHKILKDCTTFTDIQYIIEQYALQSALNYTQCFSYIFDIFIIWLNVRGV